jgi:hypothetical protein
MGDSEKLEIDLIKLDNLLKKVTDGVVAFLESEEVQNGVRKIEAFYAGLQHGITKLCYEENQKKLDEYLKNYNNFNNPENTMRTVMSMITLRNMRYNTEYQKPKNKIGFRTD